MTPAQHDHRFSNMVVCYQPLTQQGFREAVNRVAKTLSPDALLRLGITPELVKKVNNEPIWEMT